MSVATTVTDNTDSTNKPTSFVNAETEYVLSLVNNAFQQGFHTWWLISFLLVVALSFVALVYIDTTIAKSGEGTCANLFNKESGGGSCQASAATSIGLDDVQKLVLLERSGRFLNT